MALNLGDAWEWIDRARQQNQQLDDVYREWVESAGIVMLGQRDPQYMLWEWDVAIAREPSTNLSVIAGEVFDALRRALDYVAWQVYVEGSAEKSEKQNRRIYFPIVTDPDKWERELANKVPGASAECVAALRASQPFAQQGGHQAALPALAAFINSDKHRRLSLFASAVFSVSAIQPDLGDDLSMGMAIMHPPPMFHIREAIQHAREAGALMPSWLVAFGRGLTPNAAEPSLIAQGGLWSRQSPTQRCAQSPSSRRDPKRFGGSCLMRGSGSNGYCGCTPSHTPTASSMRHTNPRSESFDMRPV